MAQHGSPDSAGARLTIDAGRLWAGGAATAVVAGLVAVVGVVISEGILDITMVRPQFLLDVSDTFALNYFLTAAVAALVATGLAHLLVFTTPRPQAFYSWIVGLATAVAVALPFAKNADTDAQVATAVVNLVIGLSIMTLIASVVGRTVSSSDEIA